MKEDKYSYGTCHVCGEAIAIPGHDRFYCERCGKWLPHPKNHSNERLSKPDNTERVVRVWRLPDSQLTLDLQGGES
jgi:predicted amidophosphoribosyltransferase